MLKKKKKRGVTVAQKVKYWWSVPAVSVSSFVVLTKLHIQIYKLLLIKQLLNTSDDIILSLHRGTWTELEQEVHGVWWNLVPQALPIRAAVGGRERRLGESGPFCERGAEILDFWFAWSQTDSKKHGTVQKKEWIHPSGGSRISHGSAGGSRKASWI